MTAMARPNPQAREADESSIEDDPLVELARIVSGRSDSEAPRRRAVFDDEPALSEADLARDLEMELLSDLQASFAAADEGEDDQPPFYAEEDLNRDDTDYGREAVDETAAAHPDLVEDFAHPDDADYGLQGPAFDEVPETETAPAGAEGMFSDMDLRGSRGGPAYDPTALSEAEGDTDPVTAESDQLPPATGWAATAEEDDLATEPYAEELRWEGEAPAEEFPLEDPDPAYSEAPAVAPQAFSPGAPQVAPAPAMPRHRDRRLDSDPDGFGARRAARRRSSGRYYTVFGVLALVAIGTAAVLVLQGGEDTAGAPPLITADAGETRVFPEEAPVDDTGNVVFERAAGEEAPGGETILPGAEPMADINAATETNDGIADILTPADPNTTPVDDNMPRMVRTVTVLPDGTILTNGTTADGVPPVDGAAAPTLDETPPPAAEEAPPAVEETPPAALEEPPANPVLAEPPAVEETPPPAEVAVTTPPATPTAADPIAPGLYVQVAALGTEALAQATLQDFRARAPAVLQSEPAVIQRADLANGVFYRVWFGPLSSGEAESLRQRLAAVGIDSFIQAQN